MTILASSYLFTFIWNLHEHFEINTHVESNLYVDDLSLVTQVDDIVQK